MFVSVVSKYHISERKHVD